MYKYIVWCIFIHVCIFNMHICFYWGFYFHECYDILPPEKLYFLKTICFFNFIIEFSKIWTKQFYNDSLLTLYSSFKINRLRSICVVYFLTYLPFLVYYFEANSAYCLVYVCVCVYVLCFESRNLDMLGKGCATKLCPNSLMTIEISLKDKKSLKVCNYNIISTKVHNSFLKPFSIQPVFIWFICKCYSDFYLKSE